MIVRHRYLDRITPFIDKPLIKVVTGIRRCGKSTLLKQIADSILEKDIDKSKVLFINKELFEFDFIKNYPDLHHYVTSKNTGDSGTCYLFIDEVQEIQEWEKAVNSFLAEGKYDIFISGSNARMLSSDLATLIAGRYVEFRMYPLAYTEFLDFLKMTHVIDTCGDPFMEYIKYGGFPGLHHLVWDEEVIRQYLSSLYHTVVLKDVVIRNQIRDVAILNRVFNFIATNCGNITTAKSIRDYWKSQGRNLSTDTVINYIQFAMDALLIHQVKRFDIQGKRTLETFEKYFLSDTGFSFATIGNTPSQISGKLENIVLIELLSRNFIVTIGKNNQQEIDFIASRGNDKLYIQVCTTLVGDQVWEREYNAFRGIQDHYPKLIVSLDTTGFSTNTEGVKWMNIKDFLLDVQ
ncbi:MAG: ATP-binding protein [Salinivirgaceae bacterium]|nr:ATP-binding protein [Salinivirgaceae bacterium]